VEAATGGRYGWLVEDRSSWLPAGLESPSLEPDDRASQRRGFNGGSKRPGPRAAAGDREPHDRKRPEHGPEPPKPARPASGDGASGSREPVEQKPAPRRPTEAKPPQPKPEARPAQRKPTEAKPAQRKPVEAKAAEKKKPQEPPAKQKPPATPAHEQHRSEVDAMGQDKHRQVVGQRYGVSRARSLVYYGIFIAIIVGGYFGGKAAVDSLDKAPARDPDKAPWSKQGAPQIPLGGFETGGTGPTKFQ
jgi:outer membrane biosynthesis protein TonB